MRDHLREVTDLGTDLDKKGGGRNGGDGDDGDGSTEEEEEGADSGGKKAPMMYNLGARDRVLLVAEGAAELRKLIEMELVDVSGDVVKVTDDSSGGSAGEEKGRRALRVTSRDRTGLLAAMCEAFERAGVAIDEVCVCARGWRGGREGGEEMHRTNEMRWIQSVFTHGFQKVSVWWVVTQPNPWNL